MTASRHFSKPRCYLWNLKAQIKSERQNILLVGSNNEQFIAFTGITATDLNTNLFKFDTCNNFLHCSQCSRGEFSTSRSQTEYYS